MYSTWHVGHVCVCVCGTMCKHGDIMAVVFIIFNVVLGGFAYEYLCVVMVMAGGLLPHLYQKHTLMSVLLFTLT